MIITCKECSTSFNLDDSLVKESGSKCRCSVCSHVFTVYPPPLETDSGSESPADSDLTYEGPDQEFEADGDLDIESFDSDGDDTSLAMESSDLSMDEDSLEIDTSDIEMDEDSFEMDEDSLEIDSDDFDADDDLFLEESDLEFDSADFETDDDFSSDMDDFGSDLDIESFDSDGDVTGLAMESSDLSMDEDAVEADTSYLAMEEDSPAVDEDSFEMDEDSLEIDSEDFDAGDDLSLEESSLEIESDIASDKDMDTGSLESESHESVTMEQVSEPDLTIEMEDLDEDEDEFELEFDAGDAAENAVDSSEESESLSLQVELDNEEDTSLYDQDELDSQEKETSVDALEEGLAALDKSEDEAPSGEGDELLEEIAEDDEEMPLLRHDEEFEEEKKKPRIGIPVQILLLICLLVVLAYVTSIMTGFKIPYVSDIKVPYISEMKIPFVGQYLKKSESEISHARPLPNQQSVNGRFVTNPAAGTLFVITGRVDNPSDIVYSHIQVRGALITEGKKEVKRKNAFCGNVVHEEMLKTGSVADINKILAQKSGNNNMNVNIKPKTGVPFMIVFADLPEKLENFTVKVTGFEKSGSN